MANKPKKNKRKKKKPEDWTIHVNSGKWKGFDQKLLQSLINSHMEGQVNEPKKGSRKPKTACLNISLGGPGGKGLANPIGFSVKICPTYPCTG